jgi:hypothetical protein
MRKNPKEILEVFKNYIYEKDNSVYINNIKTFLDAEVYLKKLIKLNNLHLAKVDNFRENCYVQAIALEKGIKIGRIDGIYGDLTDNAIKCLIEGFDIASFVRPDEEDTLSVIKTTNVKWPKYKDIRQFYGAEGSNQVRLTTAYPLILDWSPNVIIKSFSCHKLVHDTFGELFEKTLDVYGQYAVNKLGLNRFGGCLNVRPMKGSSNMSVHSWGVAIDLYPSMNQLHWKSDKALFAKKEYDDFWQIVSKLGLTSLGKQRNFDWMHIQAVDL